MATLRWKLLPLFLLLLPYGLLRQSSQIQAGPPVGRGIQQAPDQEQAPIPVELSELLAAPLTYLGQRVSFAIQFDAEIDDWNPMMTRFSDSQWGSFSGWSDDQFTWLVEVYENSFQRMYFPADGLSSRLIARARRFERFQVTACVRELLLDEPYIEVESLEPLYELVDEGSILHVSRGLGFAVKGQLHLAKEQFERARTAPLPQLARDEIERLIALCL